MPRTPRCPPRNALSILLLPLLALGCVRGKDPVREEDAGSDAMEANTPSFDASSAADPAAGNANPAATVFDHSRWNALLGRHVDERGWVDYAGLQRDEAELRAYLEELAAADPARLGSRAARMAFWINAYNALCAKKILDKDIPESVPKAIAFGANIFTEDDHVIAGEERSLDDIEHQILRPNFEDPRVHAAIVCAASSCPRLRNEAYDARRLEAQLEEEVRSWLWSELDRSGKRKNRLDAAEKTFHASKIFDWFQEDFGGSDEGVLRFVAKFASEEDRKLLESGEVRVRYLDYDWTVNRR